MSLVVPFVPLRGPAIQSNLSLVEIGLAAAIGESLREAPPSKILEILEATRPPLKRVRKRIGRSAVSLLGELMPLSPLYQRRMRELQSVALFDVRTHLPAALAAYYLAVHRGSDPTSLFRYGLLSGEAFYAIAGVSRKVEVRHSKSADLVQRLRFEEQSMTKAISGLTTDELNYGFDVPLSEADPDVLFAFKRAALPVPTVEDSDAEHSARIADTLSRGFKRLEVSGRRFLR